MRTVLMIPLFAAVAIAPVIADTEIPVESRPTSTTVPLANNPHAAHSICHTFWHSQYSYCASILETEKNQYYADSASVPAVEVIDSVGARKTGRRDVFAKSKIVKYTSETTASATAWLSRFQPLTKYAGLPARPAYEDAKIDSCDEYSYKRYYQANRHLDSIGQLTAANRFIEAVNVVLDGVPATTTAKALPPVSAGVADFDGRPITGFNSVTVTTGFPLAEMAPPPIQNPFYGVPTGLMNNLPLTGAAWEQYLPAAMAAASSRPASATSTATWDNARALRNNTQIKNLSPAERDDVAGRITRMRRAVHTATKTFEKCTMNTFRAQTASTNQLPFGQTFEEYVGAITNDGVTDPVDLDQLNLIARLVDDSQWSSTLTNVYSTSIVAKDVYGSLARTPTGALLRKLGALNFTALQQAIVGTKTTFKSGTWSPCNGAFYDLAQLLVEEYRRGEDGCMAQNNARCEFSFPVYARDVSDALYRRVASMEDTKDICLKYLGADWNAGTTLVPTDKRDNLAELEVYLRDQRDSIDQLLRTTPKASSLPMSIGDRRGGYSYFGDSTRFGAGYTYSAEWGVNPIEWRDPTTKTQPCRLGGQVEGSLRAWVNMFSITKDLVDAGLKARTAQTDKTLSAADRVANFDTHVELLGYEIFNIDEEPVTSYSDAGEDSFDISLVRTTILLGFIPVTISAGFGFDYGYTVNGGFTQSTCDAPTMSLKIWGNVTPRAGANAFVEAYVDLFIAGAGVKGELTLIEASLPLTASLEVINNTQGYSVVAKSELALHLTELSGAISFIVKALGITVWETELFSWDGIHQDIPLWKADATFPIIGFDILY